MNTHLEKASRVCTDAKTHLIVSQRLFAAAFWNRWTLCFWADISGNIGTESSISESKVQAQGPAIPECRLQPGENKICILSVSACVREFSDTSC